MVNGVCVTAFNHTILRIILREYTWSIVKKEKRNPIYLKICFDQITYVDCVPRVSHLEKIYYNNQNGELVEYLFLISS